MLGARLRSLTTRLLLPLSWRRDDQHVAQTLKRFSDVEFDSAWQYLNAMKHVPQPAVQRLLFENLLEEMEHADAFLALSHGLARQRIAGEQAARVALVDSAEDIPYFLAYAHESERSIALQFDGYARACGRRDAVADVFRSIALDETTHEQNARASLVALIGDEAAARRLHLKVKFARTWQSWTRGSKRIGDVLFALIVGTVFVGAGLLFGGACRRRIDSGGQQ